MFINLLPLVALRGVPVLVCFLCALNSLNNLNIIIPRIVFRKSVTIGLNQPEGVPQTSGQKDSKSGFCGKGELVNFQFPENGTVYLQSSLTSGRQGNVNGHDNVSVMDMISRSFQTAVMDCPELRFSSGDLSRTFQHLKWITAHHSRMPPETHKLKVWFRPSAFGNNVMRFDEHYCIALAVSANQLHPETVTGFILNSNITSPLVTLKSYGDWEIWKKTLDKFGLQMGCIAGQVAWQRMPD